MSGFTNGTLHVRPDGGRCPYYAILANGTFCEKCGWTAHATPAPSPLAVPDTVRQLVWEVADALGDEVTEVAFANGLVVIDFASLNWLHIDPKTAAWEPLGDFKFVEFTDEQRDLLDRLAIEVEQWASGLVAQAVTDGDWRRP